MISKRLRRTLAAIALSAAAPASYAWTRISCDLGGTVAKPVGTVIFARAVRGNEDSPEAESKLFDEQDRAGVRRQATLVALELLLP